MQTFGYHVMDVIVQHFAALHEQPVTRKASRSALEALLREPLPMDASDPIEVLAQLQSDVFPHIMYHSHPRFFAFVPSPSNFVSVMGDALASAFNPVAATWLTASGPAQIELVTIDWLRQLCGLPEAAGGLFVSGGSEANLTALMAARHAMLDDRIPGAVAYCSDQTHSSAERAFRVLGFERTQLRKLPSDEHFRLPVHVLRDAILADRAAGKVPFCVIATAGATNTGAVDPLSDLADCCHEHGLWLHVDGAIGAAATLSNRRRSLVTGLDRADSVTFDPHKWLFQPFDIGCVLVRNRQHLRETFHILPEYLKDTDRGSEEVNFCDYGIQLARRFRALKLWMSLKTFGLNAFEEAVDRGFTLAELAEEVLRESPHWEVITPAQMGIITFRYRPLSSTFPISRAGATEFSLPGQRFSVELRLFACHLCTLRCEKSDAETVTFRRRWRTIARRLCAPGGGSHSRFPPAIPAGPGSGETFRISGFGGET